MANCLRNGSVSGLDQVAKLTLSTDANIPVAPSNSPEISAVNARQMAPVHDVPKPPFSMSQATQKGSYIPRSLSKYPIPQVFGTQHALRRLQRTLRPKPRLDPIPDSPFLTLKLNPDAPMNGNSIINESQNTFTNRVSKSHVTGPSSESPTDNESYIDHNSHSQLQHSFSLGQNDFLESQQSLDPSETNAFIKNIPSRRNSTGQQEGSSALAQNVSSASQTDLPISPTNQISSAQTNLTPPRDLLASKSRSESALSSFIAPPEADLRRNSSDTGIVPPETLISSLPRRDSAWTAEVLSIEILVDYVMDPGELWGQNRRISCRSQVGQEYFDIFVFSLIISSSLSHVDKSFITIKNNLHHCRRIHCIHLPCMSFIVTDGFNVIAIADAFIKNYLINS